MKKRSAQRGSKWTLLEKPGRGEGRVIGQVRFSSELQDKRSIAEQKENIARSAESEGWTIVGWCEEPATSAQYDELERRPEFMRLITQDAGVACNVVMCDETSRWSRSEVGNKALKLLRLRKCWWQTADSDWDINKPLTDGGAILWAITQSQNEDFLRKLSYHVRKGKKAKAREGYSNGNPMFGYRIPAIHAAPQLGELSEFRRRRVVYEPHPSYFPGLVRLGELLAEEPPRTLVQIAEQLNRQGFPYWSYVFGERPWSPQVVEGFMYRAYQREYKPSGGRGTVVFTNGETAEGMHVAAWPYELCTRIDNNRSLLARNRSARPRKGNIHAFSGLVYCRHCQKPLGIHPSTTYGDGGRAKGKAYTYVYYACDTPYRYGTPCKGSEVKRWMSMRAEVVEHQFGQILDWLGEWSIDAIEHVNTLYDQLAVKDETDAESVEKKRADLVRRRDNLSKQHEMGFLTDEQLAERMGAVIREEAQLPSQHVMRQSTPHEAIGYLRGLGDQWRALVEPSDRVLRYRLASTLVSRVYLDLAKRRIVGLEFKQDLFLPARHTLQLQGWSESADLSCTLWNDHVELPTRLTLRYYDRVLEALRQGCTTSGEIMRATGISNYRNVNGVLRQLLREGIVTRERVVREGKQYRFALLQH